MKTSDKSKAMAFAIESAIDALFKATQHIDEPDDDCAHWVNVAIDRLRQGLSEAGATGTTTVSPTDEIYRITKRLCSTYDEGMPCAWETLTGVKCEQCPQTCDIGKIRALCNQPTPKKEQQTK